MRYLVVVLVAVLLLGPGSAVAQSRALASLSGLVYDQASGQPLIDVHVFLDQTMRGTVTDREGRFHLPSISPGVYTLVVSMIGFEVAKRQLTLSAGEQGAYRFGLKEAVIPLPEGLVTAEHPRLWRKRLKRFKHLFFGETQNASSCALLNPEVLDFEEDEESGRFTARASEPLRIVNRALGYEIEYHLRQFVARGDAILFDRRFTRYRELEPKNDRERRRWIAERWRAYYGSFRHFVRTLSREATRQEGFIMYQVPKIEPVYVRYLLRRIVDERDLFRPIDHTSQIILDFDFASDPSDPSYLLIEYVYEAEEGAFQAHYGARTGSSKQISWMALQRPTMIDLNGHMATASLVLHGYWGWAERVADLLPNDFALLRQEAHP